MLLCMLASPSPAQDRPTQRAPIVRVYPQDGGGIASSYITPAIEVSEDAYVFAVMMDLDGRIQVLYPELPGISVRVRSRKELRLPNFFAGFNAPRQANPYYAPYGQVRYERYDSPVTDTRGTIIALASRAPFNFDAIEADGDWDLTAIRQLIDRRAPSEAARALIQFLGAKGEPIGRDYMRFSGQHPTGYYASNYGYDDVVYCGYSGYGYGSSALYRADVYARAAHMRSAGLRPFVVGYDACGLPIVIYAPFSPRGGFPGGPLPRSPGDTTVFPKERFPRGITHRPTDGYVAPRPAAEGIFPLSERPQLPVTHNATMPAPEQSRGEREIRYRLPTTTASPFPERPATPAAPTTADRAPMGVAPVYRPEPRVITTAEP
ncbi:MAG TPA: hypothetical protein VD771_07350, partial [Gemmatimonadaceae bacterium]|nr:hypothetical protein [Gemmatimonadaceae bacterium]